MNLFKKFSFSKTSSSSTNEQLQGKLIKRFGRKGQKKGQLDNPRGIALTKSGDIVVSDSRNHRIQIFSEDGTFQFKFGEEGSKPHNLFHPRDLDITPDDLIAVADIGNSAVKIFTQRGQLERCIEDEESIRMPNGLAVTHDGYIVVTDISKHCVIVISPLGDISHSFTSNMKNSEELDHPYYLATNSKKQIIVSDADNNAVKIFSFNGSLLHAFYPEDFKLPSHISVYLTGVTFDRDDNPLVCCGGSIFRIAGNGHLLEVFGLSDGLELPMYLTCSDSGRVFVTQMTPNTSDVFILLYNQEDVRDAMKSLESEDNSRDKEESTADEKRDDGDEEKSVETEGTTNTCFPP